MNASEIKDLHYMYLEVIFQNSLKIAQAFRRVQFERNSK